MTFMSVVGVAIIVARVIMIPRDICVRIVPKKRKQGENNNLASRSSFCNFAVNILFD